MSQQTKPVVLGIEKDKSSLPDSKFALHKRWKGLCSSYFPRDCLTSPLNYLSKIMVEMQSCSQEIKSLVCSAALEGLEILHRTKLNYLSHDNLGADVADWVTKVPLFHGNTHSAHFQSRWNITFSSMIHV